MISRNNLGTSLIVAENPQNETKVRKLSLINSSVVLY